MRRISKSTVLVVACMAAVFAAAGCGKKTEKITVPYEAVSPMELSGNEFIKVGEGSEMLLLVNPSTGTIRWENINTGEYMDNKLSEETLSNVLANSDVVVNYYNGSASTKYESTGSMDTYNYGYLTGEVTFESLDNGVRMVYKLFSDAITYNMFPTYITDERLNSLILDYCDDSQKKSVIAQYRQLDSGIWVRKTNKEQPLKGLAAKKLYNLFYEVGHYTSEELYADCVEWDRLVDYPEDNTIYITTDYYLDGNDLVVRIPCSNLVANTNFPIASLDVLPYFMATEGNDGYLFVPDGSGALIYLDSTKVNEYQYSARYFGGDVLKDGSTYSSYTNDMMMPVYGMKDGSHAVLGIIEKGAEICTLNTYVKGVYAGINYSRASLNFIIRDAQLLDYFSGATVRFKTMAVCDDYYTEDIQLRYRFLTGSDADYTGMANAYRDYLVENNFLKISDQSGDSALYINLLGEIDKELYFAGIPYNTGVALTSFEDAAKVITELSSFGISNIKVLYDGMLNNGMNQRAIDKVKISSKLGGEKEWNKLVSVADSLGVEIYPRVNLNTAYTSKRLSKDARSYDLKNMMGIIYDFKTITHKAIPENEADYPRYIIAPGYISEYVNKFVNSYNSRLSVSNIASKDFMTFYAANYRANKHLSQTSAIPCYEDAIEKLTENNSLILSNPVASAYAYTDCITDIPNTSSGLRVLDADIPFMQLVFGNTAEIASETVNIKKDDIKINLLHAIEGRSSLNFRFITADPSILKKTELDDIFYASYDMWKQDIKDTYYEYNSFYKKVKGACVTEHEIVGRDNNLRVVTYSNGVRVYLNYGDEKAMIKGVSVDSLSFVIME